MKSLIIKPSNKPSIGISFLISTFINGIPSKKFYGNSLVGNFLQMLYIKLGSADTPDFAASGAPWNNVTSIKRTTGALYSFHTIPQFPINADPADVTHGLLFGQGTTAAAPADYVMETLIDEGTGTDEFNYGNQTATQGCVIASQVTSFILQRIAVNNSGAAVDVTEIILQCDYSSITWIIFRDVFSPADEVPDGSDYRVTLEISITT